MSEKPDIHIGIRPHRKLHEIATMKILTPGRSLSPAFFDRVDFFDLPRTFSE
jgi:hypothetical protein